MKTLLLSLSAILLSACQAMTLDQVTTEVGLAADDLAGAAEVARQHEELEAAATLEQLAGYATDAHTVLGLYGQGEATELEVRALVRVILDGLQELAAENDDPDLALAVYGADAVFRRVLAYLPPPPVAGAPPEGG